MCSFVPPSRQRLKNHLTQVCQFCLGCSVDVSETSKHILDFIRFARSELSIKSELLKRNAMENNGG